MSLLLGYSVLFLLMIWLKLSSAGSYSARACGAVRREGLAACNNKRNKGPLSPSYCALIIQPLYNYMRPYIIILLTGQYYTSTFTVYPLAPHPHRLSRFIFYNLKHSPSLPALPSTTASINTPPIYYIALVFILNN